MEDKHGSDSRIDNLDTEELRDLVLDLREQILKKIKKMSRDFHMINELQDKRDRAEDRLAELGGRISIIRSKARDWEQE